MPARVTRRLLLRAVACAGLVASSGAVAWACASAAAPPVLGAGGSDDGGGSEGSVAADGAVGVDVGPDAYQCGTYIDAGELVQPANIGAPAYVYTVGPSANHPSHGGTGSPSRKNCMGCHSPEGGAGPFYAGGTLASGAPGVQIVIRDGYGRQRVAYSDTEGNFFFRPDPGNCFHVPMRAATRTANGEVVMPYAQLYTGCNACHIGGVKNK